ncbi:MAG TPA: hypothetical protein VFM25_08930 [Verrucomicrobiae bacterium]|nr:hypothetical protein [Verrucomicrobiae bacterium]
MSLINDALQRAKHVQHTSAPVAQPNLQLRPVDASQPAEKRPGVMLYFVSAVLIFSVLMFLLKRFDGADSPAAMPVSKVALANVAVPTIEKTPAPSVEVAPEIPEANHSAAPVTTNMPEPVVETPVPPKPATPKLQAIVFSATNPSAIVNGKTVFVGDNVGEFRVAAITPKGARLVSETQTNLLTLDE